MSETLLSSGDGRVSGLIREYGAMIVRICRLLDAVIILTAFLLFMSHPVIATDGWFSDRPPFLDAIVCVLILQFVASFFRLGRSWRMIRLRHELAELLGYWAVAFVTITALFAFIGDFAGLPTATWLWVVFSWFSVSFVFMAGARTVVRMGLRHYRARGNDRRVAAIIGSGSGADQLFRTFRKHGWMGIDVCGIYDDCTPEGMERAAAMLLQRAEQGGLNSVYITLPMSAHEGVRTIVERFQDTTVSIYYCPPLGDLNLVSKRWDDVFGQPVFSVVDSPFEGASGVLKRAEDLVLCFLAAPILVVPMVLCALAIRLTSKGPVIFRQTRYGLDGKPFVIRKFRTMYDAQSDVPYKQATRNDPRVTPVGRFLRKTSLDELPQFLNVLDGSMSVVGPRPHPIKLDEKFRGVVPRYILRNKIKPGITGLAQVNGWRGETETLEKMRNRVEQDIRYLKDWSLLLDLKILFKTLLVPFQTKDVY